MFVDAIVVPGLLFCRLGAALIEVIESALCALRLRVPQVCLPGKKGRVRAIARHRSLLPPQSVAGLALYACSRGNGPVYRRLMDGPTTSTLPTRTPAAARPHSRGADLRPTTHQRSASVFNRRVHFLARC